MNSSIKRYEEYLNFKKKYIKHWGYGGDWKKGEIELLEDIDLFSSAEKDAAKLIVSLGISASDAQKRSLVGVRDETRWGVTVCEPVKTPSGHLGTFVRFIPWSQIIGGVSGIVVVPVLSDGRFVFIKTFRNATRSWCLEFPRGIKDVGKDITDLISEELSLEAGAVLDGKPVKLGQVEPDDGAVFSVVDIYKVEVKITKEISTETMEAISGISILGKGEIKKLLKTQKYIDSDGKKYEFKDGFTLSALALLLNN
ncbi:hypothetical protein ISR94_03430 [Candidatus Microgenomates bacterium]|nr:hypothetical protein [Candidatus Microgenomates bacterium]